METSFLPPWLRAALAGLAERRYSQQRYLALFESLDEGFCIVEVYFDNGRRPLDYRFLEVNPAFERQSGLRDVVVARCARFRRTRNAIGSRLSAR